jgi:hypothetical protein
MPSSPKHPAFFAQKYLNEEVARTLVLHVEHFRDFTGADHMKRVVGLMHRIGVKRQAEGIFFKVCWGWNRGSNGRWRLTDLRS